MTIALRRATHDDLAAIALVDGRAFGAHYSEQEIAGFRPLFEPDRFLLACDADEGHIVGVTGDFPFTMTLPGGGALAVPGVTWVSVTTTHRRRGVLRTMLAAQHRGFIEDGVAVSILTASEGSIYGRFGYGPATTKRVVEIDRRLTAFRPEAPDPGGVRQVEADEARKHAPDVHHRWCTITPGALSRSPAWWDYVFLDRGHWRRASSALFHLVHPDGWTAYRINHDDQRCRVVELVAATEQAHAALWRVLLGLDLVHTVSTERCPLDDPLPFLLADPRRVRTVDLVDGVWARLLDMPAALSARRYGTEVDVTIEVHDAFLDRGGRFRLRGGPAGASCDRTDRMPDVHAGIAALGSLYLGGHRAQTLARAGLVQATDPAVLSRVDAAFTADRSPQFGTEF